MFVQVFISNTFPLTPEVCLITDLRVQWRENGLPNLYIEVPIYSEALVVTKSLTSHWDYWHAPWFLKKPTL